MQTIPLQGNTTPTQATSFVNTRHATLGTRNTLLLRAHVAQSLYLEVGGPQWALTDLSDNE